ncbi:hypothetical protein K439DRAFT_1622157 [Ramaria rubella]|nr:hypothetical protein K439DRAFT_1622157 [Ramaria rubella]
MAPATPILTRVLCIPRDLEDGDHLYQPIPKDHFSIKKSLDVMSNIADHIERIIGPKEPYEINLLGLRNSMPAVLQPVLTIGIANSDRLAKVLPTLEIPFVVHLSSNYPTSFSNGVDRNPRPEQSAGIQQNVPSVGSSCGLLADDRHSVTLGSYIRLSSMPKKLFVLTAPLSIGPSVLVTNGNIVTQPSVADRDHAYASEDRYWRDVLKEDREQGAAVAARRAEQGKTLALGRTAGFASRLQQPPEKTFDAQFEVVWDGSQPKRLSSTQSLACASDSWAVFEVTRETTVAALSVTKKKWPFRGGDAQQVRALVPGLTVMKKGRTTGQTLGTVNGAKSLYRLPRDGSGIRRYDYSVVSYPWGGIFSSPGDAGAVALVQQREDMEDHKVKRLGNPCALVVASSTSGHVSFVQDMESVGAGVKNAGLGNMTFVQHSG